MMHTLRTDNFQIIIDFLSEPIFIKDNEHRILHANKAFCELFHLDAKDIIGFTLAEAVPENERELFLSVDRGVLDTGISDQREETLTLEGITRTIVTSKQRYVNPEGEHFLIGSIQDITELKAAQNKLIDEKAKLQQALHEIKTLKGILPICSYCRKIRDDEGSWQKLEEYVAKHTTAEFSHGICQDCLKEHFPQYPQD